VGWRRGRVQSVPFSLRAIHGLCFSLDDVPPPCLLACCTSHTDIPREAGAKGTSSKL
jgi:hypothetical protein